MAAHRAALGAEAEKVGSLAGLADAMARARGSERSYGIVIETDPAGATEAGGHWWEVAVAEVSYRPQVRAARAEYEAARVPQRRFGLAIWRRAP